MLLEALPLTANGKVERRKLPLPDESSIEQSSYEEPRSPIEEILVGVWEEVLKVKHLGIRDNFFSMGGHSLLATQVVSRLRAILHIEVPLRSLFEASTIAELAPLVEQVLRGEHGKEIPPLLPASREGQLPLSFAQQRLWFLDQLEPGGTAYNIPVAIQLSGAVSIEALGNSLGEIMRRHEALRTTFHIQEGEPVQIIEPAMPFYLPLTELNGLSSEIQEIAARQLIYQEALRPFNLAQEPLLRATVLRMRKDEHILLLSMHHIASDGWSSGLLIHELISLYTAYIQGKPSPLAELPVQYADFACWQRQWLQGEVLETQLAYWTRQLTGIVPLQLPTDQPRMAMQRQRGTRLSFLLPPSLSDDLKALSQSQEVTLFITLLAAFQVLLARYTNQTDISVGTPIANRTQPETEGLIGFFVNTLVMRTNMADNPTFLELLERVREIALGAYAHPDLPFERLVEILQPRRDLSYSPLFQVLFILQHVARYPENLADVKLKLLEQVTETARYDLTLSIVDGEQGLDCVVEYNTDLFQKSTIRRLMGHWQTLLNGIIARPEQRLTALPLLTAAEHQHLLHTWNDTERDYGIEQCAHQIIEQQVKCVPDAIAVICGEEQISYQQLNRQANQLAHMLIEKGIGPEISVALLAERSITFVSSILAIFKAGGVYIPLDPLHPHDRLCQMLRQSACQVVVVDSTCLPTLTQALSGISTEKCPIVIHLAEIQQEQQERLVTTNPPTLIGTGNLAYVIYTSGSTGMPKGVMVEHGGMLNHIYAKIADTQLSGIDSVAQNGPQCFDISVWQSLAALLLGGRVEVMPDEVALKPERLLMAVEERAIAVLQLVPSMLRALITEIVSEEDHPELSALRWLVPTGDALPAESCREWLRLYPAIPLLNTYGSTECSDDQCHFPVTSMLPLEHWTPIMPIGLPIGNMHAYVLDTALMMVPVGVVGELYIGGLGVGRGYLNDPERTAKAFLPDPWSQQPGGRLYKASDMARRLADGPIEFLGRNDHLVKIRGYRIELSEIEGLLEQHVGIRESVVIAYEGEEGNKQLVSYIVPEQQKLTVSDLRNYLGGKLPVYMLPSRFIFLEALPLTPNGKLDRHGLPAPDLVEEEYGKGFTAPLDPLQEMIATIWAKILKVERVGIHEDFFALGGHSLLATQISAQVHKMMDVELPLRSLFESPTVAGLAERVRGLLDGGQSSRIPPILPVPREGNLPLSFAQQRLWFLDQLEPGSAFYNIPAAVYMKGTLNVEVLERSIQEVVRRHETLRTTFSIVKDYPVQVIGTSTKLDMLKCDLVALAPEQNKSEERRLRQEDARRPFNLASGPLLRILLLQVHEDEYVLQLTMHHIASDGWSIEVLVREISLLYTAFVNREPSPLAELPISYADFAYWQREWLRGEVLQVQLDYWKKQLAGATPLLLPTDHPRALKQSYHGASYSFMLPLELSHALGALSRQEGTTLFMTLLAAFQMLLYRYTNQDDIVVGTDIANRTRVETEVLIGFFVNLLVMRTDFSGNPLFRKVLSRVRQMVLSAYTHQDLPFELLVESLRLERNVNQVPLVQVLFVLQNMPQFEPQLPDITLSPLELEAASSKFDLAVFLSERAEGLYGLVNYSTDLFEASTIVTMMARFEVLLRNIIQQPDVPVDTIEMYTEAEKLLLANEKQMWRNAKQKKLKISKREDIELPQDIVREESHR
jgi:amino acid adenylation domain-containing protein